jgi:hypothetical protein
VLLVRKKAGVSMIFENFFLMWSTQNSSTTQKLIGQKKGGCRRLPRQGKYWSNLLVANGVWAEPRGSRWPKSLRRHMHIKSSWGGGAVFRLHC